MYFRLCVFSILCLGLCLRFCVLCSHLQCFNASRSYFTRSFTSLHLCLSFIHPRCPCGIQLSLHFLLLFEFLPISSECMQCLVTIFRAFKFCWLLSVYSAHVVFSFWFTLLCFIWSYFYFSSKVVVQEDILVPTLSALIFFLCLISFWFRRIVWPAFFPHSNWSFPSSIYCPRLYNARRYSYFYLYHSLSSSVSSAFSSEIMYGQ